MSSDRPRTADRSRTTRRTGTAEGRREDEASGEADRRGLAGRRPAAALAALTVLAQIAYPLTAGEPLRLLTIATVLVFAAASVIHAASTRGARAGVVLVVVAGGIGLLAEAVGVSTGVPFGEYTYADSLGPKVLDVPVIVPLAWLMMAYPCLLLGRRLARATARKRTSARLTAPTRGGPESTTAGGSQHSHLRPSRGAMVVVLTGGLTLAAWDLFLDPQMVAAGHWSWKHATPALPGVPGVPLTNYAGWVVVALVLMAVLHRVFPEVTEAPEDVPGAMLAWTWAGSTLGNAVFFGRPLVAMWGGVLMGLFVVPYLVSWWDDRR